MLSLSLLQLFAFANAAKCDPDDVRDCLATFEKVFLTCAANDLACQCGLVLSQGSVCFDGCPEEALDEFVTTYADGVCRKAEAHALENEYGYYGEELGSPKETQSSQVVDLAENKQASSGPDEKKKKDTWWSRIKGNNNPYQHAKQQSKSHSSDVVSIQTVPNPAPSTVLGHSKPTTTAAFADQIDKAIVSHHNLGNVKAKASSHTTSAPAAPTAEHAGEPASDVHIAAHPASSPFVEEENQVALQALRQAHHVAEETPGSSSHANKTAPIHQSLSTNTTIANTVINAHVAGEANPHLLPKGASNSSTSLHAANSVTHGAAQQVSADPYAPKVFHLGSDAVDGGRKNGTSARASADPTKQSDISPLNEIKVAVIAAGVAILGVLFI